MYHDTMLPHYHKTRLSESIEHMENLTNLFFSVSTEMYVYSLNYIHAIYKMLSIMCLLFSAVVSSKVLKPVWVGNG